MTIEKIIENGKLVFIIGMLTFGVSFAACKILTTDNDLADYDKWYEIKDNFEKEIKGLNLPPKTAINKFENFSKSRISILLTMRYRTELSSEEFLNYLDLELKKKGWVYQNNKSKSSLAKYNYQRGKFSADIYEQGKPTWGDEGNYFVLQYYNLGLQ